MDQPGQLARHVFVEEDPARLNWKPLSKIEQYQVSFLNKALTLRQTVTKLLRFPVVEL
jgi:hypothetical protein